jgi:hypothetical protein
MKTRKDFDSYEEYHEYRIAYYAGVFYGQMTIRDKTPEEDEWDYLQYITPEANRAVEKASWFVKGLQKVEHLAHIKTQNP